MLSRSVLAEPAPSAPLAGTSRLHRKAAYPRCLRCAGAPRRPASGSGLSLPFRPDMPSSLTPGSSDIACVQFTRCRHGLRRDLNGSALPTLPQSVSRGARFSRLHWFATATACQVARPPGRIGPSFPGPPGTFTSRLPAGRSPFPPLDMTTTATGLLCWRDFHPQEWQLASLHRIPSGTARLGAVCQPALSSPSTRMRSRPAPASRANSASSAAKNGLDTPFEMYQKVSPEIGCTKAVTDNHLYRW